MYAESVIPRTILAMPTSYILNVCILPTKETDGFENFSNLGIGNEQIQSIGEFWGKFRNYALINQDQVLLTMSYLSLVVDFYFRALLLNYSTRLTVKTVTLSLPIIRGISMEIIM